jgi:hypothetical protein
MVGLLPGCNCKKRWIKQGLQREIGRHARLGERLVSLTKLVLTVATVEVEEADETPDP